MTCIYDTQRLQRECSSKERREGPSVRLHAPTPSEMTTRSGHPTLRALTPTVDGDAESTAKSPSRSVISRPASAAYGGTLQFRQSRQPKPALQSQGNARPSVVSGRATPHFAGP